jgi:hypothetical protein
VHFCVKCGTPLDSYASTGPYEQIFSRGNLILKQTASTTKRQLVATWAFWGWIYVIYAVLLVAVLSGDAETGFMFMFFLSPALIYATLILRKAHRNYNKHVRTVAEHIPAEDESSDGI